MRRYHSINWQFVRFVIALALVALLWMARQPADASGFRPSHAAAADQR